MKILHIIKTKVANDGRLHKTLASLHDLGHYSKVVALDDSNIVKKEKNDAYELETFKLTFRSFFKKNKGYLFKIPEYTFRTIRFIIKEKYDVMIIHDNQNYLLLLLLPLVRLLSRSKAQVVWDAHELPHEMLLKNKFFNKFVFRMHGNVDTIIFTNAERQAFVHSHIQIHGKNEQVLNNYPSEEYINQERENLPLDAQEWLGNSAYFLWQGMAVEDRNFPSALKAYLHFKDTYKLIILGAVSDHCLALIKSTFGERYSEYIYHKFVAQADIVKYVDNAKLSIVLYNSNDPNNMYCEANRIYQPITRGIPVVCGFNPPMKNLVDKHQFGISLVDDGRDAQGLAKAISAVLSNYSVFSDHCYAHRADFSWDQQASAVYRSIIK